MREIATELDRNPSTVSRELRCNRDVASGSYRPFTAQRLAVARRTRPGRGKLISGPQLREFVADLLNKRWSPNRFVTRCANGSLTNPTVTSCLRRSIRRCTALSWADWVTSCRGCCVPAGAVGDSIGTPRRVGPGC